MFKILQKAIKYRYLLSWLIAFFIGGILYSFTCHAQAMPSIDASTFTSISSSNSGLIDVGFSTQNLVPYTPISTSSWSPWNLGYSILSQVDIDDCEITLLTDEQKAELMSQFTIVNVNGTTLTSDANIYCLTYDNGYFSGACYVDSTGKLLSYTNDLGGKLLQSRFGGGIKGVEDWEDLFYDTSIDIKSDQFLLTDHPEYITNMTYYFFEGNLEGGGPYQAYDLYIPNQYNPGVIVPATSNNGEVILEWYFNSDDAFIFHTRYGNLSQSNRLTISSGTYSKNGVSYTKKLTLHRWWPVNSANNDFFDWLNGSNILNCTFATYGLFYNTNTNNNASSTVAFKPIQTSNNQQIINYNYYYDPESISELQNTLNNLQSQINSNFDNSQNLSNSNVPFYYPATTVETSPSEIPFPNIENYPEFNPLPSPSYEPALNYGVVTQPTSQSILDSFSNLQVPFLQNIRYRFPFCIPWDLHDALSLLQFSPTAPAWDFDWEITALGTTYTYHCVGDLSDYDSLALLFRRLMLCAVFIGLAFWTYKLML